MFSLVYDIKLTTSEINNKSSRFVCLFQGAKDSTSVQIQKAIKKMADEHEKLLQVW